MSNPHMKFYPHLLGFLFLWLTACKTAYIPVSQHQEKYKIESGIDSSSAIERMLKPYRDSLSSRMNEVIGTASDHFVKQKPSGSLGNLVSDAMLTAARKTDPACMGAVCNYGGIRIPQLSAGPVTVGRVFEMLPFDNELVLLKLPGSTLRQWCKLMAKAEGWPIAGFSFNYRDSVALSIRFDGQPFDIQDTATYTIVTNDYIANGGDQCSFLQPLSKIPLNILVRDAMLNDIRKRKTINPDLQERIHKIP
ncbi:MAG: 5'-nucleotidase C-terminal domain-containing protein [Chitinophagaceae bacterium]|nr:5'-nucleotidase C-terminal domain-containing protein [Chitinophagaceae bacterium]